MTARLTDPWFEAEFYGDVKPEGGFTRRGPDLVGSQGLMLWCPCGFGKVAYPLDGGRPHMILVPFRNPSGAPVAPDAHGPHNGGKPVRWLVSGTGLADLTITPSVAVGKPECWHGFITNGEVTP